MADTASTSSSGQQQTIINIKSPLERKQDVFDTEDFDANKFINQIYPDGESFTAHQQHRAVRLAC
jgi:hypothetical protein